MHEELMQRGEVRSWCKEGDARGGGGERVGGGGGGGAGLVLVHGEVMHGEVRSWCTRRCRTRDARSWST